MPEVHQVIPSLSPADALGNHVWHVQRLLRDQGLSSEIFTIHAETPALAAASRPLAQLPSVASDAVVIYHASIGSEAVDTVLAHRGPLVVDYHNLTPVELLVRWDPTTAHLVSWGRVQLAELADHAVLGIGDSGYNVAELEALGYRRTAVAPVLFDSDRLGPPPDHRPPRPRGRRWLFVGRIVPNKAQHDVIAALAHHRATSDPEARLTLVGREAAPAYAAALRTLVDDLDLHSAVDMPGTVSDDELARHYRDSDVFVCLSDHEGFCVPLIEAMQQGVPIVALAAGAVPDTLGPAGVLLLDKSPGTVSAAVDRVLGDEAVAAALVAAGRRRVAELGLARTRARFLEAIAPIVFAAEPARPG